MYILYAHELFKRLKNFTHFNLVEFIASGAFVRKSRSRTPKKTTPKNFHIEPNKLNFTSSEELGLVKKKKTQEETKKFS